ncbi:MAG: hypothetical protein IKB70_00400 [Bacilli bacterium]|nr:hypothetical protein [Bacilli bacterium]
MCKFRNLKKEEIDVRVATITSKGFSLLLYKDARCDMNILDETIGSMNWQRGHTRDNANCIVSIWDDTKKQWISKEDTGVESNTEKEKGLASDSFKRACFNWGIGRELYTAPFIWVSDLSYIKANPKTQKQTVTEKFKVSSIEISNDKVITSLEISDSKGNIVFSTQKKVMKKATKLITADQINRIIDMGIDIDKVATYYKVNSIEDLTCEQAEFVINKKSKRSK